MNRPSLDVDNTHESATHGTAQGSCTSSSSSPRRNSVLTAERATFSGSIDSVSSKLHDTTRASSDSPEFGDVDTTLPREETRAPNGDLLAANTAASQVSVPQTADSRWESQAQASRETHSGPQVGRVQTSTLDEGMVNSERTPALTTNPSSTNSQEFLEWKAKGRPRCPKCLKQHFGPVCNMTKWESDLLKRDPEGYARYRKRMAKPASRRNDHKNRVAKPRSQPPQNQPRQHGETRGNENYADSLSPFCLQSFKDIISSCSTVSELEGIKRIAAQHPDLGLAVVGRMAAAAQQAMMLAETHSATSQTADNPQQDTIADEAATNPPPATASDDAAPAIPSSNNGPSVDFRTGAERALDRNLEQGGPSAKAEGKQPKK